LPSAWPVAAARAPQGAGARIEFQDVSLHFRRYGDSSPSLKQTVINTLFRRKFKSVSTHELYRDLSLGIGQGERVGIIGHNGAGKSTLLKMICGIYRPSAGMVRVRGRVAPLIELGAGFSMELSGVENIFLNGAVLGFSPREMQRKVEPILEFAGLREHANMPVKYYSSGMLLRLAFSIATDIDPEILLIDEILGAGDLEFQGRAAQRMRDLQNKAHIIVVVSHALTTITQMCTRCLWIDHGKVRMDGDPAEVCAAYTASVTAG
jgi:ABC-type polysaccharide/polyol phosphate transport system ATPase subunit